MTKIVFLSLTLFLYFLQTTLGISIDENERKNILASKLERLLQNEDFDKVENLKNQLAKQIEINFIKTMAAAVIATKGKDQQNILQVMRQALNGEFDFQPEINHLPTHLRQESSNQNDNFQRVLKTIQQKPSKFIELQDDEDEEDEDEENKPKAVVASAATNSTKIANSTTTPAPTHVEKILDSASKININEVSTFLKQIPSIFEGVESIIDGVDEYFK